MNVLYNRLWFGNSVMCSLRAKPIFTFYIDVPHSGLSEKLVRTFKMELFKLKIHNI